MVTGLCEHGLQAIIHDAELVVLPKTISSDKHCIRVSNFTTFESTSYLCHFLLLFTQQKNDMIGAFFAEIHQPKSIHNPNTHTSPF
ncbi:hypothetical protein Hanom_Chr07g00667331 [Helianthus anomalus]